MPWRNGLYVRLQSWVARAAAGASISPTEFDADGNDIATALDDCLLRDGTSVPTADLPMALHSLTGIRQAAAAGEPVEYAQWQAGGRLVGEIVDFGGTTAPTRWLMCDGRAVSRTTYALLFAAIGTTYGAGDGSTTFNLPDLRGRATFGSDTMSGTAATSSTAAGRVTAAVSGVDGTTLGASGGDQRLQSHTHKTVGSSLNVLVPNSVGLGNAASSGSSAATYDISQQNTGTAGAGGSQNMPPALVVAKIICAGA